MTACIAGDPVEVLITMFVSSVSSISEVNMVGFSYILIVIHYINLNVTEKNPRLSSTVSIKQNDGRMKKTLWLIDDFDNLVKRQDWQLMNLDQLLAVIEM